MALADILAPRRPADSGDGLLARLRQAFARYRAYRSLHDELSALSDRELSDIGISRHSIPDVARAAAYRS